MTPRESDPSGAFTGGGAAGLDDDTTPESSDGHSDDSTAPGVDETEREVITSGTAATSETADPDAQAHAEGQGDGTPQPR